MGATAVRGCAAAIPRASMSHIAKKARGGGGRAAIARPHSTANEDAVVVDDDKDAKRVKTSADKGCCPSGWCSLLPRIGVCPVCKPVIREDRLGAHTVLPA